MLVRRAHIDATFCHRTEPDFSAASVAVTEEGDVEREACVLTPPVYKSRVRGSYTSRIDVTYGTLILY